MCFHRLCEIAALSLLYLFLSAANSLYGLPVQGFPKPCSYANDREALPGHLLRLGKIQRSSYGFLFFFPDRNDSRNLQSVSIADNAGIIGQQNLSRITISSTPAQYFVVAQIFIGTENNEPQATCISTPIAFQRYAPTYYGSDWTWLDRTSFYRWLKGEKFHKWAWRKWWQKDFDFIRNRYRRFKDRGYRWSELGKFRNDDRRRFRSVVDNEKKFQDLVEIKKKQANDLSRRIVNESMEKSRTQNEPIHDKQIKKMTDVREKKEDDLSRRIVNESIRTNRILNRDKAGVVNRVQDDSEQNKHLRKVTGLRKKQEDDLSRRIVNYSIRATEANKRTKDDGDHNKKLRKITDIRRKREDNLTRRIAYELVRKKLVHASGHLDLTKHVRNDHQKARETSSQERRPKHHKGGNRVLTKPQEKKNIQKRGEKVRVREQVNLTNKSS